MMRGNNVLQVPELGEMMLMFLDIKTYTYRDTLLEQGKLILLSVVP